MDESKAWLPVEPGQSDEERRTRIWRRDQLVALGFDVTRATLMADDTRVDLEQARMLIARGCPLETATRILV